MNSHSSRLGGFLFGIALAMTSAHGQVIDWGQGPHWKATYTVTNCDYPPLPPDYIFYFFPPCNISFPFVYAWNDADARTSFYFSDDRPGLMVFESTKLYSGREVRNLTFNSAQSEFSFSRPGDYRLDTLWLPIGSSFRPTPVTLEAKIHYVFTVTSRSATELAGTFVVTRPFVTLYRNYVLPQYEAAHPPWYGTATATGVWSAHSGASMPRPWMNGFDFCDSANVAYRYDYPPARHVPPAGCNPDDATSFCGSSPDSCVYQLAVTEGAVALVNPLRAALKKRAFYWVDIGNVLSAGKATAFSADGVSAVVVALKSQSSEKVTFSVAQLATYATLTEFHGNYLDQPNPGGTQTIEVGGRPDGSGSWLYLALLWPPDWPDSVRGNPLSANLTVTATQAGATALPATIKLQPPPLLLVHGIWSSADEARFAWGSGGFADWIAEQYPHSMIRAVDYRKLSATAFGDRPIQDQFKNELEAALSRAASFGTVARTVDVFAHSMGGLVTQWFLGNPPPPNELPANLVHRLVTVGTPYQGSPLAANLLLLKDSPSILVGALGWTDSLGGFFKTHGKDVEAGAIGSLVPDNHYLNELALPPRYHAIGGQTFVAEPPHAPVLSVTEIALNFIIALYANASIGSLMGTDAGGTTVPHDTIVPLASQLAVPGDENRSVTTGIVHSALVAPGYLPLVDGDIGETVSPEVWNQALFVLTGQQPIAPAVSRVAPEAVSQPAPSFDLTGFTEVDASNVTFSPATGTVLTIEATTDLIATSATKTISEILLFQKVHDPSDLPILYATQAPFSIPFRPTRLGVADFVGFALFDDQTYAVTELSYALQHSPPALYLMAGDGTDESLLVGTTVQIDVTAIYPGGPLMVTDFATYTARSGTAAVFSVAPGGATTAVANGVDWLDVSYLGLTASLQITVDELGGPPVLDVDASLAATKYDALTDGLLVIRYLFGFTGPALTTGALGITGTRTDPALIETYLDSIHTSLDIDGNGIAGALTDGLLVIRYLFGFRDTTLIAGAVDPLAIRKTATEIEAYIQSLMP